MTYLSKDVRDRLAASTQILDAFSNRIFADVIPQATRDSNGNIVNPYPCVIINDLSNDPEYILAGEVGTHTSIIQVDVWTDGTGGKGKANELGELVRNRLSGYKGTIGTGVEGSIRMIRNNTLAAPPADGSDIHRRRVSMDFEIIHSASAPTFA